MRSHGARRSVPYKKGNVCGYVRTSYNAGKVLFISVSDVTGVAGLCGRTGIAYA